MASSEPMDPEHEPMDPEHDRHYENELTKLMEEDAMTSLESKVEKLTESVIPPNVRGKIKILTESPRVIPPNVRGTYIGNLYIEGGEHIAIVDRNTQRVQYEKKKKKSKKKKERRKDDESDDSTSDDSDTPLMEETKMPKPVTSYERELKKLDLLAKLSVHKLTVVDVPGGGSCLYHAFITSKSIHEMTHDTSELRRQLVKFLESNPDTPDGPPYKDFLCLPLDSDRGALEPEDMAIERVPEEENQKELRWQRFLKKIQDGEWGGSLEIMGLAQLYNVPVTVLSVGQNGSKLIENKFNHTNETTLNPVMFIGHLKIHGQGAHFVAFKPLEEKTIEQPTSLQQGYEPGKTSLKLGEELGKTSLQPGECTSTGKRRHGTGFRVGSNFVMTAFHVMDDILNDETPSSEQSDNDDEEEEGNKSKSNEHFSTTREKLTFTKKQQGENGEADIRKRFLVNSLDIETKPSKPSRNQIKSKDYGENLHNLDYLDCADLNLVDECREGIAMKSFSGCNVQDFLKWMEDFKEVLRKTKSTKQGSVSSALFAVYTKEAILEFKEKDLVEIIDYSIRCAIESDNCILVSEIVRTYLFDRDIQLQRILQDIKRISPAIIDTILQTVRNLILRKFRNLQNNGIVLSFCWECGKENRLVMVMSYRGKIEMSDRIPNEVLGFKLVLYNFTQPSEEASSVLKSISVSKKTPLPTITETEARELFRKHSNLTMISASPYKSMGYSKGKHIVVEKTCISLFCFYKGYIPYGEERFPKKIGEFEVDVQEGYCYFGAGRSIESGGHIKRVGSGSSGSIGGFVDLPDNKVGLITCAHVVFSPEELDMLTNGQVTNEQLSGTTIEVETFDKNHHSYNVCGKCVHGDFPLCTPIALFNGESASSDPKVDVALIELHQDIDTFEFRAVTSEQLQSAGFDPRNPPVFSGEAVSLPDPNPLVRRIPNKSDSVVKYGAKTGFTIGNLYLNRVHVRIVGEKLDLPGNSHCAVMCDQIEIQSLPQGQFFECGDSGSFVFCINPNKTLSCLGMAVGVSTGNSCLVTPIGRVLENVRLGTGLNVRLKPYGSSGRSSQNSSNTPMPQQSNNNTTSPELQLILGELMKMRSDFQSMQTEIRNLQCQVTELKDSTTPPSSGHSSSSPN